MQILFRYLPFIILPFTFPGISVLSRLLAFFLALGAAGFQLYRQFRHDDSEDAYYSIPLMVFLSCLLLFWFQLPGDWETKTNWPVIITGMLLAVSLFHSNVSTFTAIGLFTGTCWALLLIQPHFQSLMPFETFHATVASSFQYAAGSDSIITQDTLILNPAPQSYLILFHTVVVITTLFFFIPFFTGTSRLIRWPAGMLLILWSLLLLCILGNKALVIVAINLGFFAISTQSKARLWRPKYQFILIIFVLLCVCAQFPFVPSIKLFMQQFLTPVRSFWSSLFLLDIYKGLSESVELFNWNSSLFGWPFLLIMAFCLMYFLLQRIRHAESKDPDLAVFLIVLTLLSLFVYPNPLALISHPMMWLIMGILFSKLSWSSFAPAAVRHYIPYTLLAILFVITLPALSYLYRDWRAELYFQGFKNSMIPSQKLDQIEMAFRHTPYRGDMASLYATSLMYALVDKKLAPQNELERRIEQALVVSAQYDYIPLLAYKRISDLYFLHIDPARAISILQDAVKHFPEQLILQELLADRLEALGQRENALTVYRQCINLDPTSIRIRKKLMLIYQTLGMEAEFEREREQLAILDPTTSREM